MSMPPNINFSNIRHHSGSQPRAFEELCYQLIPIIVHLPPGANMVRHGTPDGGVEFLAYLPDGNVWGWQAKYLFSLGTTEFQQLDRSVRAALEAYPSLSRYTFCLPYNRPAANVPGKKSALKRWEEHRQKWAGWAAEKGVNVQFEYVGESELLYALTSPGQEGRVRYWFDKTILSSDWFKRNIDSAIESAGPRYTPELNVELPIGSVFEGLGRTQEFQVRLRSTLRRVREKRKRWYREKSLEDDADLRPILTRSRELLDELDKQVMDVDVSSTAFIDFDVLKARCRDGMQMLEQADEHLHNMARQKKDALRQQKQASEQDRMASQELESLAGHLRQIAYVLEELENLLGSDAARLVNVPAVIIQGHAGTGKTHLLCDIARSRCEVGQPTVILLGERFTEEEPWKQVLDQLNLNCDVDEFLGALQVAAEVTNSRALILIDAVNEGEGLSLWKNYLSSFLHDVRRYPRLGVALSCRTSYVDAVVPGNLDKQKLVRVTHDGFLGHEYQAVRTFFDYYKLQLPDFPLLVPEFRNPLFLKLMCRGLSERGIKTIPRGSSGITWLFDQFLEAVETRLCDKERCDYARDKRLVRKAVKLIVCEMLGSGRYWLPFDVTEKLTNALLPGRGWSNSLLNGLLSEGVLSKELMGDDARGAERVFFSYQRLGDYLQAEALCERHQSVDTLASELAALASDIPSAYRHSGLLEALAVLVPERFGRELHELVPDPSLRPVQEAYLESLIWRDPKSFPAQLSLDYLNTIGRSPQLGHDPILMTLLQIACIPEHPFNALFLHRNLWHRSMAERDAWWSIFLHWNYDEGTPVDRLIEWAWSEDTSYCADDAALLCATTLAWFLTSSNRLLRDHATKALVSLLNKRLGVLVQLLEQFDGVNDPYVAERLYAVAYGCALISSDIASIATLAQKVYDLIFANDQPPVHILLRDYARGVIERAAQLGCSLTGINMASVRPPYRSPWPLRAPTEEQLRKRYYNEAMEYISIWSSVMSSLGDFHKYVIDSAVRDFLAPSQRRRLAIAKREARKQAESSWRAFVELLNKKQKGMLDKIKQTNDKAWKRFQSSLSQDQEQAFLKARRDYEGANSRQRAIPFDTKAASRWVFNRVITLGWTPNRFGDFDRSLSRVFSQTEHKVERIGKKYQWIALHELLARIADHCQMLRWWGDEALQPYEGPWQVGARDIDPSLRLRSTRRVRDSIEDCWWAPVGPKIPDDGTTESRNDWLRSSDDLPSPIHLIDVTDKAIRRWVVLEGRYQWEEDAPPEIDRYDVDRCNLRYQIGSYLVRKSDLSAFKEWAKGKNWMDRRMPELRDFYRVFIGEYPWRLSASETLRDWEPIEKGSVSIPVLISAARYVCEGGGFDCSLDDSVHGLLPSSPLVSSLGLRWSGQHFEYVDENGQVIAWDPSAKEYGPSVLLVDFERLKRFLDEKQLAIVWTIFGEKLIYGAGFGSSRTLGWLEAHGLFVLEADSVREIEWATKFTQTE